MWRLSRLGVLWAALLAGGSAFAQVEATPEEPEESGKLIDLMAALEASVNAAKAAREAGGKKPVSVSEANGEWDRSVFAGEAGGRWLWIVLRPASAMLLLRDEWILRDVSGVGPPLVEMPFDGPRPPW